MSRLWKSASLCALTVLFAALLAAPTTGSLEPAAAEPATSAQAAPYQVRGGITFNSATGTKAQRRAIIAKINQAIAHAPRGSDIRILSWKIWTRAGVTALLDAQRRGVKVLVLMDKNNTIVERNPHFPRLRKGLAAGNSRWPAGRKSGARLCQGSCRGDGGAAHSKFMLFSKSGVSQYVYMAGSANWGDAAAQRQWNDMITLVGMKDLYAMGVRVFNEAWLDKPVAGGNRWREYTNYNGRITAAWSPTTVASRAADRLLTNLRAVKCRGATGGAGNSYGRTIIRSAPDVFRGNRGMAVAKELRRLWDAGCDVKIGYTVIGVDENKLLRRTSGRGPVPMRQLVEDHDGDGVFDRYFHLKVYTINGVIGDNTSAYWFQQGSANTADLALASDENFFYFSGYRDMTLRYQNHINYWYAKFPASRRVSARTAQMVSTGAVDPYANMELD